MKLSLTRLLRTLPVLVLTLSACAHHEVTPTAAQPEPAPVATPAKVEYEFGGRCAASVKANHFDVQGDPKYTIENGGKTYCFSSAKARDTYSRNLDKNIKTSQRNWDRRAETIR
jgi:hypothetical protein